MDIEEEDAPRKAKEQTQEEPLGQEPADSHNGNDGTEPNLSVRKGSNLNAGVLLAGGSLLTCTSNMELSLQNSSSALDGNSL